MASIFALLALSGVALLALFPNPGSLPPAAMLSEKATLFFLAVAFLVALVPSLHRRLTENRDAATYALLSAFFVLYHLADRAGPRVTSKLFSLHLSVLPDDQFPFSYALRLVVVGALVTIPLWIKGGGPQRFILSALLLIGVLGVGTFAFLSKFYTVSPTETLDPTPLPTLFLQILGYASVAALCRAATATPASRALALRALPFALLLILGKYQFLPMPVPAEDAE